MSIVTHALYTEVNKRKWGLGRECMKWQDVWLVREWIETGPQHSGKKYGENFKTGLLWDVRRRFHSTQLTDCTFQHWRWRQCFLSKVSLISSRLHGVQSEKIVVYIVIVLQTWSFRTVLRLHISHQIIIRPSGVPRVGFGVLKPSPPRNSEGPPQSCQTQPDCENC